MRKLRNVILLVLTTLWLTGCGRARPDDLPSVLAGMVDAGAAACGGAVGKIYTADWPTDDPEMADAAAMPESLIAAAFGTGSRPPEIFSRLEGYAVWFCSFAEPIEYGCFVLLREGDVGEAAEMCLARIDAIKELCGQPAEAPPPLVMGRCVFYAVGPGAEQALDAARAAMSG